MASKGVYTLYISTHCISCSKIKTSLTEIDINYKIINIDESTERPAFPIIVVPAMVCPKGNLIGYGQGIINYFQKSA